jgi:transposase
MRTLPTYSPELNPCELMFGRIKNHLRYHRGNEKLWAEILKAVSIISYKDVLMAYYHALRIE